MFTLKVAHKVIIGFGFIALLLLLSSGSALVSFSAVTRSSELVNQLAVPVQQQSNMAQIQLLKLLKLVMVIGLTRLQLLAQLLYQVQQKKVIKLFL